MLEKYLLGRYRAKLAAEQIDIEALALFHGEDDAALQVDLGIEPEDLGSFRSAVRDAMATT